MVGLVGCESMTSDGQVRAQIRLRHRHTPKDSVLLEAYDPLTGEILARRGFDVGYPVGKMEAAVFKERFRWVRSI